MRTVILTMELSALATFTGDPEASSGPASNLKHPEPRRIHIAPGETAAVMVDLTDALAAVETTDIESYRYVCPLYWRVTRLATFKLYLAADEAGLAIADPIAAGDFWKTLDNDLGRFPRRHRWIDLGEQHTEPWMRLEISDPTNPRGQIEGGILLVHPGYQPPGKIQPKPTAGGEQPIAESRSISGARRAVEKPMERTRTIVLQATGEGAREEIERTWVALQETCKLTRPICVLMDADAVARTMDSVVYGTLGSIEQVDLADIWQQALLKVNVKEKL